MAGRPPQGLWRRTPRPWHGMTPGVWLRLLVRNRFAVSPSRLPMALAATAMSLGNAAAGMVQRARYGRAVAAAVIDPPPLFIVGHWRTGTTLLHELLALDPQFRCPTTYECMAPAHFLVTQRLLAGRVGFLLPERRPMDAMRLRWTLPQEDEFALSNLGALSAYHAWAFPHRRVAWEQCLDPRDFTPAEQERWRAALLAFYKALTIRRGGRLILKSPPHTARLGVLAAMFPGALFVHTVRHPNEMVPSLIVAWRRLAAAVGLQAHLRPDFEDFVLRLGASLYRRFDEDRAALGPGRIVDLRYEDLVSDPAGELERLYGRLGLAHADRIRPMVSGYLADIGPYTTNEHPPTPQLQREIARRWAGYARRYGYLPN